MAASLVRRQASEIMYIFWCTQHPDHHWSSSKCHFPGLTVIPHLGGDSLIPAAGPDSAPWLIAIRSCRHAMQLSVAW